eukprot:SAG25_NODE_642_length_6224_cov_2.486041_6_plen_64_part_00
MAPHQLQGVTAWPIHAGPHNRSSIMLEAVDTSQTAGVPREVGGGGGLQRAAGSAPLLRLHAGG